MTRHVPPGRVSRIRGRWQGPGLQAVAGAALVLAAAGLVVPGRGGTVLATAACVLVVGAHPARVGWLVLRWTQEHDRRFLAVGVGLLCVLAGGAALAAAGLG